MAPPTFTATLASATVAGDCPDPAAPASADAASQQPPGPGDIAPSRRAFAPPPCAQSQMQVHFELRGAPTATIRIVDAEAFDGGGTSLGKLTPRAPQTWDAGTSTFLAWDQQLIDGVARDASYKLSAPATQPRSGSYQLKLQVEAVLPDGTERARADGRHRARAPRRDLTPSVTCAARAARTLARCVTTTCPTLLVCFSAPRR